MYKDILPLHTKPIYKAPIHTPDPKSPSSPSTAKLSLPIYTLRSTKKHPRAAVAEFTAPSIYIYIIYTYTYSSRTKLPRVYINFTSKTAKKALSSRPKLLSHPLN